MPVAARPPASRIPRAVGDRSEIGERLAERPGGAHACASAGRRRRSGRSASRPTAPRPPTTNAVAPIAAAAACVVGAGSRPIRITLRVAGTKAYTASLAVPFSSEPPAITSRAAGRRDRRVAQRMRQVRDDARAPAGPPGDDRVEPARARVAADDVRRPADGRAGLVRAAGRQPADRLRGAGARVDHRESCRAARRRCRRRRRTCLPPIVTAAESWSAVGMRPTRCEPARVAVTISFERDVGGSQPTDQHGASGDTARRLHPESRSRALPAATGTRRRIVAMRRTGSECGNRLRRRRLRQLCARPHRSRQAQRARAAAGRLRGACGDAAWARVNAALTRARTG